MISDRESHSMTTAAYVDTARTWVRRLEDAEAIRSSVPVNTARSSVARKVGVHPGALANIRHGRIKAIAAHVFDALRGAVERELLHEIARLEHELALLRQSGVDPREDQMREVETHLAAAREALTRPA
jgi:transposase-like protein